MKLEPVWWMIFWNTFRSTLDKVEGQVQEVLDILQRHWNQLSRSPVPCEVDRNHLCFEKDVEHQLTSSMAYIQKLMGACCTKKNNQVGWLDFQKTCGAGASWTQFKSGPNTKWEKYCNFSPRFYTLIFHLCNVGLLEYAHESTERQTCSIRQVQCWVAGVRAWINWETDLFNSTGTWSSRQPSGRLSFIRRSSCTDSRESKTRSLTCFDSPERCGGVYLGGLASCDLHFLVKLASSLQFTTPHKYSIRRFFSVFKERLRVVNFSTNRRGISCASPWGCWITSLSAHWRVGGTWMGESIKAGQWCSPSTLATWCFSKKNKSDEWLVLFSNGKTEDHQRHYCTVLYIITWIMLKHFWVSWFIN